MVAFDAVGPAGGAGTAFTTSPGTWTHVNGGNGILVGVTILTGTTNTVTGVTYGGVTVPLLGFVSNTSGGIAFYGLQGVTCPTGSNTVSVAFSDAGSNHNAGSVSVSGAGSFGAPVTAFSSVSVSTISAVIPGTTTGGLVVSTVCFGGGAGGGVFSATAPNVVRWAHNGGTTTGSDNGAGGTDPSTGGGASQTVTWTNSAAADDWGIVAVEVLPPADLSAVSMTSQRWSRRVPLRRHRQQQMVPALPAAVAPFLIQYSDTGWTATASAKSTASLSWNAGDLVVIVAGSGTAANAVATPTFAGGTFVTTPGALCNAAGSNCYANAWTCTPAAPGSGAVTSTGASGSDWGMSAWVWRSAALGAVSSSGATGNTTLTQPLTLTGAGSAVVGGLLDWGAGAVAGYGFTPATAGDRQHVKDTTSYTAYVADWASQGTGTVNYGITGVTPGGNVARVVVEIVPAVVAPLTVIQAAAPVHLTSLTGPVSITLPQATGSAGASTLVLCAGSNGSVTANPHISGIMLGGAADHWASVAVFTSTVTMDSEIWYDPGCAAGQTAVAATFTGGGGTGDLYVSVYEVAGVLTPDKTHTGEVGPGTTWSSGTTAATAAAPEIAFGSVTNAGGIVPAITGPGTWTAQNLNNNGFCLTSGYQALAATGTVTFSGTLGASQNSTAAVATFSAGAGSTQQATAALSGAGTMTLAETQQPTASLSGTGTMTIAEVQRPAVALSGTGTATAGGATWGWVQSAGGTASLTSSCSVAFSRANLTAGTKIIVLVGVSSAGGAMTCTGVADTTGPNALTKLGSQVFSNNSGEMSLWAMDTPAGDVGIKPTIKATSSAGSAGFGMVIAEVSGLVTGATAAAILDGGAVAWATGTALGAAACPAFTSAASGELVFAGYGDWGNPTTWTNPAGWTPATQGPGASGAATGVNNAATDDAEICYRASSGGAESASYTITGTSGPWITFFAAFKPAGAPPLAGGATLSGTGTLTAAATQDPTVALSGTGTMSNAEVQQATVALAGTGTMSTAWVQQAPVALSGTGTMSAGPPSVLGAGTGYLVGTGSGASGATSYPLAVTGATAAGDGTVVVVATGGASPPAVSSVSDSKGNTWTIRQASTPTSPTITVATSPGTVALTTADTITIAYGSAPAGAIAMVAGAAAGLSVLDVNTAYATGSSTAPSVSGTPANAGEVAFGCFAWALAGAAGTVGSPFTQLGQGQRAGGAYATLSVDNGPPSGSPLTAGYTIVSASWRAVIVSLTASSTLTGAASLSGTGTLSTSLSWAAAASLSGSGTMAMAEAQLPGAALAGTGTIVAGPPSVTGQGAASLSGTGTLSTAMTQGPGAALSGTGTLSTALVQAPGAALSGTGTLTVPAVQAPSVALAGTGTMTTALRQQVTVALSGTGTLTANVGGTVSATAPLSGTGTMTTAWVTQPGAALSGTGSLSTSWTVKPGVSLGGRPGWLVSLNLYIHQMYQEDSGNTAYYFNLPASFAISNNPAATGIQDGFTCTPVLRYTSYAQFQADISASAIIGAFSWVMYDTEYWSGSGTTPVAEYNDPWTYMGSFVTLAHANGLKVILAPARDLGQAPGSVHPLGGLSLDNWYLTWNIPGTAAATGAEVVHVQAQADTVPLSTYTSFFASAYNLVRASSVICQVSAGISTTYGAASDMAAAASAVAGTASGFWWNATTATIFQAAQALALLGGALTTGVPVPESALLAGTGAMTTAALQLPGATLSGTGTLSTAAMQAPAVTLSGTGTMTSAQVQRVTVALSGTGTMTANTGGTVAGAASLSGAGSLSTAVSQGPGAALSGAGALSTAVTAQPGAALSGTGTMALAATTRPTAALSGTGVMTVPAVQGPGAQLSGSGTLSAGYLIAPAVAASGSGTLTTAAGLILPATAALSGSGTLSTAQTVLVTPAVALAGTGTLTTTIGGTPIFDTDAVRIEDSEFAVLSDPEAATGTDAGELIRIRDTDSVTVTDIETSAWPHDTDSVKAVDDGGWSGPVADLTPETLHLTEGGERIRVSDTESASTADAHVVQVWTYQPPFRWTGHEYALHYGDRVAWTGPRLDRAAFELADRLAQASTVEWVHDTEQVSVVDSERFGLLNVQLTVSPALEVTLTIDA